MKTTMMQIIANIVLPLSVIMALQVRSQSGNINRIFNYLNNVYHIIGTIYHIYVLGLLIYVPCVAIPRKVVTDRETAVTDREGKKDKKGAAEQQHREQHGAAVFAFGDNMP